MGIADMAGPDLTILMFDLFKKMADFVRICSIISDRLL